LAKTDCAVPPDRPWSLKKLQPLRPVAVQLMRLVSSEECSLGRISSLIRADVAFSVEVLRIANSPLFGLRGKVDDVAHALPLLGLDRVKSLVVTVALRNFLSSTPADSTQRRCWRHSIACACACDELAVAAGKDKEVVYTAGLLHDIGRLGLLAGNPAEYTRMLDVEEECGYDLLQSERDLFDVDHCQAGVWLVREWALPVEFETIAGQHHAAMAIDGFDNLKIVQLGCRISDTLGFAVIPHADATLEDILEKLPTSVVGKLGPIDDLAFRIGEQTAKLERDLLL